MNLERKIQNYLDEKFSYSMDYGEYPADNIKARDILEIVAEHLAGIQLGLFE